MTKYEWQPPIRPKATWRYVDVRGVSAGFVFPPRCKTEARFHAFVAARNIGKFTSLENAKVAVENAVNALDWMHGFTPAAPATTLPDGWVAHTPYLAERTADRAVVVMDQHGEAAPYFSRSTMPGAGRFGAFYHLRAAVEFYDKQWPARPAGWTWQAADENHGPHWRRDADGYRVTETLDQWRGVTPDGYMTTSYYKTAEAVMAFAEQTRPVSK